MIRRWIGPLLLGVVLGVAAWHLVMAATPDALMRLAVERVAKMGGMNRFTHAPLATSASRTIVRPSPDLAYSSCPFDLTGGPLLIDAVPVPAPYWSLSIFDSHTNAALVRNGEKARGQPFHIAVLAPGQTAPKGYEAVHVDGTRGIALVRILIDVRARFPATDAERRATTCRAG
ncbi:hypothetical protein GCM10009087_34760 [Sphingomonas oligophenolica]|uniref:DUF1254 domain-containing protein n=1 Tax=Sphingomonas oligophenolica TaxID=301154 RepID=A0ABU9XZ23_9SPHN